MLFEILSALADLLKVKEHLAGSSERQRRADIVLTGKGARGVKYENRPIDDSLLDNLPPDEATAALRMLRTNLRTLNYYDNHRHDSPVLVFCFHGLGLDQDDFRPFLLGTDWHCIAPTLYGFHPTDDDPVVLPLDTHCRLMAGFVEHYILSTLKKKIVLVGFSTGADLLLRLPRFLSRDVRSISGLVLLDCNINRKTCFISSQLRRATTEGLSALDLACEISKTAKTIEEWLSISQYLVRVLGKFDANLPFLAQFANQIFLDTEEDGISQFTEHGAALLRWNRRARFIFSGDRLHRELLSEMNSGPQHFDVLGATTWAKGTSHFGLLEPSFMTQAIDDVLEGG